MLTFKEYLAEGNFSDEAANSVGKKANRKQEFAKLTRRLKNTLKSTINVLSLPFAYEYEKALSKFTGKTVISFGVEFDREYKLLTLGLGEQEDYVDFISENLNYFTNQEDTIKFILSKLTKEDLIELTKKLDYNK